MSRLSVISTDKANSTTEKLMKEFTQRIIANPPGVCPVDMQLAFLKVCHAQTCGKCVPCRIGLGVLEELLESVLDNTATMETLDLIEHTAINIKNSAIYQKWRRTTKRDSKNHGFGLMNIYQCVEKLHGDVQIKRDKNEFMIDIVIMDM